MYHTVFTRGTIQSSEEPHNEKYDKKHAEGENRHHLKSTATIDEALRRARECPTFYPLPKGVNVDDDGKICIHMPGCGGLFPYAYGICGALQDTIDLQSVRFATTSGSTPATATVLYNAPAHPTLELFERRRVELLRKHGPTIYTTNKFIHMAEVHNYEMACEFGKDGWCDYALANHRVMVVRVPTKERMYIGTFDSLRDYVSTCGASCSFTGTPTKYCSPDWSLGVKCGPFRDGDLGGWPSAASFGERLSIPLEGGESSMSTSSCFRWWYVVAGLLSVRLSSTMYDEGYKDAMKILVPPLVRRLPPPKATQSRSEGTAAVRAWMKKQLTDFVQPRDMAEGML